MRVGKYMYVLLVSMKLSLRAGGGRDSPQLTMSITPGYFFIGNKGKIEPKECRSCSISCLIIACTLQFEILVTDSRD